LAAIGCSAGANALSRQLVSRTSI